MHRHAGCIVAMGVVHMQCPLPLCDCLGGQALADVMARAQGEEAARVAAQQEAKALRRRVEELEL